MYKERIPPCFTYLVLIADIFFKKYTSLIESLCNFLYPSSLTA